MPGQRTDDEFDARFPSAACVLGIRAEGGALAEIRFLPRSVTTLAPCNSTAQEVCEQLERYLNDPEFRFNLRLNHGGTEHQRAVWSQMRRIQPGQTLTYGDVAMRLKSSPRAVGQACGANPIPIVIPCHRIVARAGLGGFAHRDEGFPLNVKRWLLAHEHAQW